MFAPVSDELMRTGTLVSMLAMVGLIGSRWFGQHAVRIRLANAITGSGQR